MKEILVPSVLAVIASLTLSQIAEASSSSYSSKIGPRGSRLQAQAPAEGPAVQAAPATTPKPSSLSNELKGICSRHYTGVIQSEIRLACASAADEYSKIGKTLAQARCRLDYGEEPRLVMACLVGVGITDDLIAKKDTYKKKLQLCTDQYPVHNEIDASLQESCLVGIYLPDLMRVESRARYDNCGQISPERSFIGPCSVGLSLAQELASSEGSVAQNQACKQYFDYKQFHAGYRACLTARSIGPELPKKVTDAISSCSNVIADATNDTERAACLVGLSMYRHLLKRDDSFNKRFQKCGDNKVRYKDRDFLACLTAASLVDFSEKGAAAEAGCKEIYKTAKSRGRGDCLNSVALFTRARE